MISTKWQCSPRRYRIVHEADIAIPVTARIIIDCDIFRPDAPGKFPVILGVHAYSKADNIRSLMPIGMCFERGHIEAGDYNFYVRRGYVHVIANIRGTGKSGGLYDDWEEESIKDIYDVIGWLAEQPWSNGNVGMFGASYFAIASTRVAALKPPALKAIFAPFARTDHYRDRCYHGGILNYKFMEFWHATVDNLRLKDNLEQYWKADELKAKIDAALQDPEIRAVPYLVQALKNPHAGSNPVVVEMLLNPLDNDYYRRKSVDYSRGIGVPAYLGACWGIYGLHLPGAFRSWEHWVGPKKMTIGPPIYLDRPLYQYQYESLRWFDHWLKGIDTGIMKEEPIQLFINGKGEWKSASEWPLPETQWTPFYLHENGLLSEHEFWPNERYSRFTDSRYERGELKFVTSPFVENTEICGPIALNLYASTTDSDVLWFASLFTVDEKGTEHLLTRGWLRGSQRRIDPKKSKPWQPHHAHSHRESLTPNEVYEFNIEIRPYAIECKAGTRIGLRLKCVDDERPPNVMHAHAMGHVWRHATAEVTVYHDSDHPSHLLLPITAGNRIGTFMSGGVLPY